MLICQAEKMIKPDDENLIDKAKAEILKDAEKMINSSDDNLLEKLRADISQSNRDAVKTLCLLLAYIDKFGDTLEWGFVLGRLFSIIMEGGLIKNSPKLSYDSAGEAVIDFRIEEQLKNFTAREKSVIWAILHGASNPMSLDKIEAIAL